MQMWDPEQPPQQAKESHGDIGTADQCLRSLHSIKSAGDRYVELINFEMEVNNILETKAYEMTDEEKVSVIINLLGQEGLQLIQTFTHR